MLHGDADIVKTVALLKDRRDFLIAELEKISGVKVIMPEGAFYLWVDVRKFIGAGRKAPGSAELCQMLLEEKLVAAVPGVEFGLEGYLRLSYALDKEKGREAVRRMAELFKTLA